ncbi:MAG: phosphotransferase [Rhodobacteraceae bacterium]|nr:phosphotransferase [Paracoccaceae bacterium]
MTPREALAAWGGGTLRLIKDRENAVYEVLLADGRRAAMRLHREGYQSEQAIRSELWWMQAVAGAGVAVPAPVPTLAGELLYAGSGGRVATVISWVEGKELGAAEDVLTGDALRQEARFRAIGRLVAELHNATDALTLPDWFNRHAWDAEGFLGDNPFWGRFWESPALNRAGSETIQAARAQAREALVSYLAGGADFGLIHADVLRENVFLGPGGPVLIDFDDCGFGFRIYDLATLASQNEGEPNYAGLMAAALAGYREERELATEAERLLPMFLMLRRFASCGWIVPRADPEAEAVRAYAERAVRAAERFLRT